ncbi:MAG: 2,3,4,5-tetrahydropyridine-2,6-dicarboxylate N-succinyltransferase [Bacteroidetes bacterium]|nr:2,3,4,5-tetrahydropyridine-2,6-dicarboxylate N-succinyltransferase [Bacteroidota bacterium]
MKHKDIETVRTFIEQEFEHPSVSGMKYFSRFLKLLDKGIVRTVEQINGQWTVNAWVKKGILLGFRLGKLKSVPHSQPFSYLDKHTYPVKQFSRTDNVRIVPGGTSVRTGAYVAPSVIIMPPAYVNVGAYVSTGTMIDSHALVGSCAFIGERVHLSAASQIGGVLEPVGGMPVVIEDDVMIGGNCGIYEGTIVRRRAVIGTGVILNASTPVYDLVNGTIIRKDESGSLIIPEHAVVVAGSRSVESSFAKKHGLSLYTPLIVKYRDERTGAKTALETALR